MRWERLRVCSGGEEEEEVLLDWKRRVGLAKREDGHLERILDLWPGKSVDSVFR
jgi:hypothetical protein